MKYRSVLGTLIEVDTDGRKITLGLPTRDEAESFHYSEKINVTEEWIRDRMGKDVALIVKNSEIIEIQL